MKLHLKSLNYSTILTIFLVVILTISGELSKSFKTNLTSITGHHWVTKSIVSLIFFTIVYLIISKTVKDKGDLTRQVIGVITAAALGGIIILGFYLWHFVL